MSQSLEYTADRGAELRENVEGVLSEIKAAAAPGHEARLVAISKIKPASDIQALYDAGHRHFGENYIQEMADKAAVLPADICWHFVGSLQSNKAKLLASIPNVFVLETLASVKLADKLQQALAGSGRTLDVYLQVNTSGEDAKSGVEPLTAASDDSAPLVALAEHVRAACPALRVRGLMTIGSWEASHAEGTQNPDFAALKETRENLARLLAGKGVYASAEEGVKSLEISMGMSADFVEAVKDGSNSVRVGTRIFGARPRKQ